MQVDAILDKLTKVRRTGKDSWMACCPAHDDNWPSLTIKESDDDKILLHCFGGCSVHEIVSALGLDLSDLFPPRQHHGQPQRRSFSTADALRCLTFEGMVLAASGRAILAGNWSESEQERLTTAIGRISAAMTATGVTP